MAKSLIEVWKSRRQIFEGIKNSVFTSETVEAIAQERLAICKACPAIDLKGDLCFVPGTAPCCGICGCHLGWKVRALSEECPHSEGPKWKATLTPEEEEEMNEKLTK